MAYEIDRHYKEKKHERAKIVKSRRDRNGNGLSLIYKYFLEGMYRDYLCFIFLFSIYYPLWHVQKESQGTAVKANE